MDKLPEDFLNAANKIADRLQDEQAEALKKAGVDLVQNIMQNPELAAMMEEVDAEIQRRLSPALRAELEAIQQGVKDGSIQDLGSRMQSVLSNPEYIAVSTEVMGLLFETDETTAAMPAEKPLVIGMP